MKVDHVDQVGNFSQFDSEYDRHVTRFERPRVRPATTPALRVLAFVICVWALLQLPFEIDTASGSVPLVALLFSKLLWVLLAVALLRQWRGAQTLFYLLCFVGLCAVVPALAVEYKYLGYAFFLSFVECVLKAGFVIACTTRSLNDRLFNAD